MKKSLLVLAIAGACLNAAHAQSSVTVYGDVDVGLVKKTDTTLAIGKRDSNALGFKGVEDLGGGLKALFQVEIRFEPDTGTLESVTRPLFQGQSRVGLQGDFGMLRLGRGVSALMESIQAFEPFHGLPTTTGFYTDVIVAGYTNQPLDAAGNSFNRMSNALFYNSPEFNGFQLNTTVATKEANSGIALIGRGTAALPQYPANAQASANPFSVSATYKSGPVAALAAYERNVVESKLWTLGASVIASGDIKLMADYSRQDRGHTLAANSKTKAWVIGVNYAIGAGKLLAGYGRKQPDGVVATREASIGYEHSLSKRSYIYVDASNKKAATAVRYYDVGIRHAF
ncbi:MAG: porin [Pseudomonadota bacterium]